MPAKEKIRAMFDSIAGDYDRLNHIMSLSVDKGWRRRAIRQVVDSDGALQVLDVACGTGDFAIQTARALRQGHVTGVDLSEGMLAVMKEKVDRKGLSDRISIQKGDGESLPFEEGTFDRVTIAFGIRNFENREQGLREMRRVLRPGGRLVVLELSRPQNALIRWFYDLYFLHILPRIGGSVSGDKAAYRYLPASVVGFPGKEAFMAEMAASGFSQLRHKAFTFGLCRMYTGEKR